VTQPGHPSVAYVGIINVYGIGDGYSKFYNARCTYLQNR